MLSLCPEYQNSSQRGKVDHKPTSFAPSKNNDGTAKKKKNICSKGSRKTIDDFLTYHKQGKNTFCEPIASPGDNKT